MAQTELANSQFSQAQAAHKAGRLEEAQRGYHLALQTDPRHAEAWHLLGVLLGQSGNSEAAAQHIEKAIEIQPRSPIALCNLGRVFNGAGALSDAILCYTRAVGLDPAYGVAWNNLAAAFMSIDHTDAALKAIDNGLAATPQYEPLHDNLCRLHKRQKNYLACLQAADRGIKQIPDSFRLWIHRAEACFALGRFTEAWPAYEWRFRAPDSPNVAPDYPIARWQGENLSDKSILVWTEQGPGETFLFSSLLNDIGAMASKCIVVTTDRLRPILGRSFPDLELLDADCVTHETADFECSLISSGQWLRTSWDDFATSAPTIKADPERCEKYTTELKTLADGKPLVGIAWRSLGVNMADEKSIALDAWRPILSIPGIRFVCLQYGDLTPEVKAFREATGLEIIQVDGADPVADLDDHLALVSTMDLVITSSNTTAHAAASQGIPVWCMVSHTLGEGLLWPWFDERSDSPWYPTLKLYRQDVRNDWTIPIARVATDLANWRSKTTSEAGDGFDLPQHHLNLALAYHNAGRPQIAMLVAQAAFRENERSPATYRLIAQGHIEAQQYDAAIAVLNEALDENPNNADLLVARASALVTSGHSEKAEEDLQKVLSENVDSLPATNNLARLLARRGMSQKALDLFERAHTMAPKNVAIQFAIATRLNELGRLDESRTLLERLMQDEKHASKAAEHLGMNMLLQGPSTDGWAHLRHRLNKTNATYGYQFYPFPIWNGESISGKRVLVWTEQGIGDEILAATMINDLAKQAKSATLLCSSRMASLLKRSLHGVSVAIREQPLPRESMDPDIDVQMSFSDVGQLLRASPESFPRALKKPVLKADVKERRRLRKAYLGETGELPLVGLSWHSAAPDYGEAKSISPDLFVDLIKAVPARFVSLQYDAHADHLETLQTANPTRWVHDSTVDQQSNIELAVAQVAAMDFVVTVSNTAAHMAGALGIPTALLVPPQGGRHWYWFKNQTPSPWYPSVDLYEVSEPHQWDSAFRKIEHRLQKLAGQK